jgi:arylsulfatase A-like enzyme
VFIDVPTADAKADAESANKEAFKAVERLKQMQQAGKPFFLWIHYMDPHSPYKPAEFRNEFIGDRYYDPNKHFAFRDPSEVWKIDQGKDISLYEKHRIGQVRTPMGTAPPNLVDKTTTEVDYHVAMYDASIRFVDHQIEILLNRLKEEGLLGDSIIVLWADHGESLGDHNYYFDHGRLPYNSCLKIPFMIIHPEHQPRKINAPVSLLDLTPTLLDFLDIKRPLHFEGTSLVPLIDGKNREQREIFAESGFALDFQKILIREDWKLIYIPDDHDRSEMQGKHFELYNLSLDPDETKDLSESNPQVMKEMKQSLFIWMDSWKENFMRLDGQDVPKVEYSKEDLEKLRSLGYVK